MKMPVNAEANSLFSSLHPQLPALRGKLNRVLDLGCGNRPVFYDLDIALHPVGADIEAARTDFPFVVCSGEKLPFQTGSFDLVVSRVALPYMNIRKALREVHRILVPGGVFWATLHMPKMALGRMRASARKLDTVDVIYQSYALVNCGLAHVTSLQIPWKGHRFESVQTPRSIRASLRRAGFFEIRTELRPDDRGRRHFAVMAKKAVNAFGSKPAPSVTVT